MTYGGDTVNTASRMEEYGIEKCIQVTQNVINSIDKNKYSFEYRGELEIKGKGLMKTWILH